MGSIDAAVILKKGFQAIGLSERHNARGDENSPEDEQQNQERWWMSAKRIG